MENLLNQKTIIILSGPKRSGKDTSAGFFKKWILEATGQQAISIAYADKLKATSAALLNEIYATNIFTQEMFSNEELRQGPFPGDTKFNWGGEQVCLRTVLQKFGTEVCRNNIDSDIWTKTLMSTLENIPSRFVIITDARFPNEITTVVSRFKATHKIHTILVKRPGINQGPAAHAAHASESNFGDMEAQGLFSCVIENDSDLEHLDTKVRRFVYKNIVPPKKVNTNGWFVPERGLREHYPESQTVQNWLFQKFRTVSQLHGFQEYSPPLLESEAMYRVKSGDEIVSQMYSFETKEHSRVALRPEITPSLVRMLANRELKSIGHLPLRWFSIGECFRHESVTVGRYREHVQWNVDIIGENQVTSELDLLTLLVDFFQSVGLTSQQVVIRVGSRKVMDSIFEKLGIPSEHIPTVYQVLDKWHKIESPETQLTPFLQPEQISKIVELAQIRSIDTLEKIYGANLNGLESLKTLFNPDFGLLSWLQLDLGTVRGLGYYTGIIFEAFDRAGKYRSICGGGRYDQLMQTLTANTQKSPMVGFGFGDCVIKEVLREYNLLPVYTPEIDYCVIPFDQSMYSVSFQIAVSLRQKGYSTVLAKAGKVFKGYDYANSIGAKYAILVAPDELANGEVRVKDLRKGFDPNDRGYNVNIDQIRPKGESRIV